MALGPIAAPLAGLYGAVVLARRAAYDRGWLAVAESPLFTVSVGGLEVGGSGKTPVTGLLLAALKAAGQSVGLLTRGYGRESRGLLVRAPGEPVTPEAIGDEPAMLIGGGLDVPVAACASRLLGARALVEAGCDAAVLDDAFSHRALARHVDIVVLRGESPVGNGHLLPWGTLREPASSLARAQVVWLHFRRGATPAPEWLEPYGKAHVVSEAIPGPVTDALSREERDVRGRRLLLAAGIARPRDLIDTVEALGGNAAELVPFADHHRFSVTDAAALARRARAGGVDAVAVTAKDAVKLARHWPAGTPLWVVRQRLAIREGAGSLAKFLNIKEKFLHARE